MAVSGSHTFILDVGVCPGQCSGLCKYDGKNIFIYFHSEHRNFLCTQFFIFLKCLLVDYKSGTPNILSNFLCMADRIMGCIQYGSNSGNLVLVC